MSVYEVVRGEVGLGVEGLTVARAVGVVGVVVVRRDRDGCWIRKESRREVGVSKVRNSFVGEILLSLVLSLFVVVVCCFGVDNSVAGNKVPFILLRARGSIDLRRR